MLFLIFAVLSLVTPVDNEVLEIGTLDRLKTFENFAEQFIVEAEVVSVNDEAITVVDNEGSVFEIEATTETASGLGGEGLEIGDRK